MDDGKIITLTALGMAFLIALGLFCSTLAMASDQGKINDCMVKHRDLIDCIEPLFPLPTDYMTNGGIDQKLETGYFTFEACVVAGYPIKDIPDHIALEHSPQWRWCRDKAPPWERWNWLH